MSAGIRPSEVCRTLLAALEATEGRRRQRKRDTRPDAIGIRMKRRLLEAVLEDDPGPAEFEGWLLERCFAMGPGEGAWRAMAVEIFEEWRTANLAPSFRAWLEAGAPSDDRKGGPAAGDRDGRASCPVRPVEAILVASLALAGCGSEVPDYGWDVPTIELVGMSREARQQAGMRSELLSHMLAGPGPDSTIYEPPVALGRPPGVETWPPPTGTHGDEAAGAIPPQPSPGVAPDTAGAGTGSSNQPRDSDQGDTVRPDGDASAGGAARPFPP